MHREPEREQPRPVLTWARELRWDQASGELVGEWLEQQATLRGRECPGRYEEVLLALCARRAD